jgi:hypothetical protein
MYLMKVIPTLLSVPDEGYSYSFECKEINHGRQNVLGVLTWIGGY